MSCFRCSGALTLCLLASSPVRADDAHNVDFDHYSVHYNAFTSTFLTPEVAQRYGLTRSKAIGVLTVAVLSRPDSPDQLPQTVEATLSGMVENDVRQQTYLQFRRIEEGRSVYYVAPFQFRQSETLTFHIEATPRGVGKPLKVRFAEELFND